MAQSTGRVAGKKAFITGGAQGLGAAAGRRLAEEGAKVALADINLAGAQAVAAEINAQHGAGTAFAYPLDVTQEDQWIEVLEKAVGDMGGLSVLVNNAGIGGDGPIESLDFGLWKKVMSVNVDSVFLGAKHALTHMRAHQPGSIINLSSIAARNGGGPGSSLYASSKAFVLNLTRGMAKEFVPFGIRVNGVSPGVIMTPFHERYSTAEQVEAMRRTVPMERVGTPQDNVGVFLFLASPAMSGYITGQTIEVNGGQYMV